MLLDALWRWTVEQKLLYSVLEVEELLGLGRTTVYKLMKERKLGYVKVGDSRRVPHQDLVEFIDNLREDARGTQGG